VSRTVVVNVRYSPYSVYIGRPSKWGNPFTHTRRPLKHAPFVVESREEAIEKYEEWLKEQPELMAALPELKGQTLGCWCVPESCHGDVLARLADETP